jgi:DNA repair exonuclease SbcCD ATPase subunit
MVKLSFDSIEIRNFKCFGADAQGLTLSAFGPGLHFLRGINQVEPRLGSNGSGKSSLWDALTWCLYGKTVEGLRNPDIRPRSGKGTTSVLVKVKVGGHIRMIDRSANPNHLLLDGKEVGQEQIDALLNISFEAWSQTILLGQGRPLFFDLPPRDKMALFSDVLGLDRWERRSATAKDKVNDLYRKQMELQAEKAAYEAALDQIERQLKSGSEASDRWESEQQARLTGAGKQLKDAIKQLTQMLDRRDQLDLAYDGAELELRDLGLQEQKGILAQREYEHRELGAERLLAVDTCPTCGQKLKGVDLKARLAHVDKKLTGLTKKITTQAKIVATLTAAFNKLTATSREARASLDILVKEIANLEARRSSLKELLTEREAEQNPYRQQVMEGRKLRAKTKTDIKEISKAIAAIIRNGERASFWVKGFKEVRLYVVEEVLQELELTTNAVLEDMGLVGWEVKYAAEKETKAGTVQTGLNVSILSPGLKSPVRWETWSGGEGQRLRVIGALALSEVLLNYAGVQVDFMILDEPTRHLSPEGVRDLCDFLSERATNLGQQTWLVDHMAIESTSFASVTTIVKGPKGSQIAS